MMAHFCSCRYVVERIVNGRDVCNTQVLYRILSKRTFSSHDEFMVAATKCFVDRATYDRQTVHIYM